MHLAGIALAKGWRQSQGLPVGGPSSSPGRMTPTSGRLTIRARAHGRSLEAPAPLSPEALDSRISARLRRSLYDDGRVAATQNSFDAKPERLADRLRSRQAASGHRAIPQHDEMPCGRLGRRLASLCQQFGHGVQKPLPVFQDGLVHRMVQRGVLCRCVEKCAPAEAIGANAVCDGLTDSPNHIGCRVPCSASLFDLRADRVIRPIQIGNDQIVLAREMPVQRGARDMRFSDDPVDADRMQPLGIEQPACCAK
ncbi:hypothetical protein EV644_12314 [Kribbella orskensis]|uniref:Uncharacterized protein n=1 Tax=Kribbella orskensis TaxID=2512216 RepID=A0ABY2B9X3_9ACTN|nr:hypothetical protein EV642_125109 [Kribbella sp. VKM Ac-2500]TCO13182.1 hypothetical protein EV644_12314 [Kribbella orskensis]